MPAAGLGATGAQDARPKEHAMLSINDVPGAPDWLDLGSPER
ncbi:hypothetical protein [Actinacidiphila sp. bgisy160]